MNPRAGLVASLHDWDWKHMTEDEKDEARHHGRSGGCKVCNPGRQQPTPLPPAPSTPHGSPEQIVVAVLSSHRPGHAGTSCSCARWSPRPDADRWDQHREHLAQCITDALVANADRAMRDLAAEAWPDDLSPLEEHGYAAGLQAGFEAGYQWCDPGTSRERVAAAWESREAGNAPGTFLD